MSKALTFFDLYVEKLGWKVIPLVYNSKLPLVNAWNRNYNTHYYRSIVEGQKNVNLGILLGKIVDVEADSEKGNAILDKMLKNYPHPVYRSSKSKHHLFLNPDPNLTRLVVGDIEFRGNLHQSVLPPSKVDGVTYQWLKTTSFPIPPMPSPLLGLYRNYAPLPLPDECVKSKCSVCNKKETIHRKRLALEIQAFEKYKLKWQCHDCRKIDVRDDCVRLRKLKTKIQVS